MDDIPDSLRHTGDFLGSLTAAFLMKDTWARRLALLIGGFAAAHYCAPYLALKTGADRELAGYVAGLFSMTIVAKLFNMWDGIDTKDLWNRLLKRLGI